MATYECPNDGPFDAEPETRTSQSGYDLAVVDSAGQHPTMADQLDSQGVPLLNAQREALSVPNPAWTPTYRREVLDDPVDHQVAVCPTCGTPVKVDVEDEA